MADSISTVSGAPGFGPYTATFTLGKLRDEYVQVRVNEEVDGLDAPLYRDIEWISDTLFNITSGDEPTADDEVHILRTMPTNALIHDYSNGAIINEENLDESNLQLIMLAHQFLDGRLTATLANDLDMGGFKIINLGEATEETDAATWGQLVELEEAAQASADAAAADAAATDADRITVAADKAIVAADKATVAADKIIVAADKAIVAADKATVAVDKATVAADKAIVAADKATVNTDKGLTLGYRNEAEAFRDECEAFRDECSSFADDTAADAAQTAADRVQTGLDRIATAADAVSTANDVTTTNSAVTAAQGYASAAAAAAAGISMRKSCDVATTGNLTGTYANGASGVGATFTLTATGVLTIDGIATVLGDVVLLKDQSSAFQNGIYTVTTEGAIGVAAVLTRSTDYDTAAEMKEGTATIITQGSVNASHIYVMTKNGGVVTVGTTDVDWTPLTANATSANTLTTPRNIGGVAFDGSAAIDPIQITIANEVADTSCVLLFANAASATAQQPKYGSAVYNAATNTATLNITGNVTGDVTGNVSGNAATVTTNANLTGPITSVGNAVASLTSKAVLIGNGTGAIQGVAPGASGNLLTSNGTDWTSAAPPASVPPGVVFPYGAGSAPAGYLLCDGSAVSRSTYAALFAVVGTAYGSGDGSTTFNVPNGQGRTFIGAGYNTPAVIKYITSSTAGGSDTINFGSAHGMVTGQEFVYNVNGGVAITGLTDGVTYYAVVADSDSLQVATSRANAFEGTVITTISATTPSANTNKITTIASTNHAVGGSGGEEKHIQTITELARHRHSGGLGSGTLSGGGSVNGPQNTGYEGGGEPMSLMQPYFVGTWIIKT